MVVEGEQTVFEFVTILTKWLEKVKKKLEDAIEDDARKTATLEKTNVKVEEISGPVF